MAGRRPLPTGPPSELWRLYFPAASVESEDPPAEDPAYPGRVVLYERLRRWSAGAAAFAAFMPEDVLTQGFALHVGFGQLQQGEGAPFRSGGKVSGSSGESSCSEVLDALALAVRAGPK